MAVTIDTVYQRVQALANKEQRGYITPQEFNLFANQAQMDIFEQYFYDINQFKRIPRNSSEYSDMVDILEEKISYFEKYNIDMSAVSGSTMTLPTDVYRLGTVFYNDSTKSIEVEKVNARQVEMMQQVTLYKSTQTRPTYVRRAATKLQFYPSSASPAFSTSTVNCNYIAKPTKIIWGYAVINEQALYNSTTSVNSGLHESEETTMVMKILELAGITIKQPDIVQAAGQEDLQKTQLEKQ